MNAIVFSALWGVVMMFAGVFLKNKAMARVMAIGGALIGLVVSILELQSGAPLIHYDDLHLLKTNNFNLTFIIVVYAALLLFFLLSGRDVEKVGKHVAEYFSLLFFIMCGVCISATFNTLLMLFLGIEIMSIPLYILTGSDKPNLKSNEAALKYLLLGSFSTGILLLGITFIYGGNANGSFYIDRIQIGM
ncbi:MAG TPA: proton-conducting transporter membrane subunit, partial [Ferruginibacter sp.]|nr:proton-conducting transporter membrane subunit [Ferruginibacter sp.]